MACLPLFSKFFERSSDEKLSGVIFVAAIEISRAGSMATAIHPATAWLRKLGYGNKLIMEISLAYIK